MEPPKGFTFDAQSGKYYHSIETVDQASGAKAQLVSWFDPQTGQVTKNAYPSGPQPAAVMEASQKSKQGRRYRKSPVRAIICVLMFFCTIAFGSWKMGWLNPLFSQLGVPAGSTATGQQGGGSITAAGAPNAYQEWKATCVPNSIPDNSGYAAIFSLSDWFSESNTYEPDPKFPNGKWVSEDGTVSLLRRKYTADSELSAGEDTVHIFMASDTANWNMQPFVMLLGEIIYNADGSYSIKQDAYPELKITVSDNFDISIEAGPLNPESKRGREYGFLNAESPEKNFKMVFNRDAASPPPENYQELLDVTIPVPKTRGPEVDAMILEGNYITPNEGSYIYIGGTPLQVSFFVKSPMNSSPEGRDNATDALMGLAKDQYGGTPYFDGKYLFLDVTMMPSGDFKNSQLEEIIFGLDDEGNLVLLRDDIGDVKAGTVFWK